MKKVKTAPVKIKIRNKYNLEIKANAKRYYFIGLTLKEISKLIDAPVRTIEKWQISENWNILRQTTQIQKKVYEMAQNGKSYNEIAILINKSTATVYRYIKQAKNEL